MAPEVSAMTAAASNGISRYVDRRDAGRMLAAALRHLAGRDDLLVLGLPRGGVPVAWEVARALGAPLDVCVVRKLGVPGHEEFAMGALASGGAEVLDLPLIRRLGVTEAQLQAVRERETDELARRDALYRGERPAARAGGRTVIVVDDGFATGATMHAALRVLRAEMPERLIAAAPVGAPQACERLREDCDDVVCPWQPDDFVAVGLAYSNFDATSDEEVMRLLDDGAQQS
jgi:predicted phosphoribosyltransferase